MVVQWLRIHLPMQGTRVPSLVREEPRCFRTTKPGATTTEPVVLNERSLCNPMKSSPCLQKVHEQQQDPVQPKNKKKQKKKVPEYKAGPQVLGWPQKTLLQLLGQASW